MTNKEAIRVLERMMDYYQTISDSEPNLDQIKEYCRKRCLSIVDNALLHNYIQNDRKPIHEYVEDFINCTNKETCQECKCQTEGDYFICALLQFYRDKMIDRIYDLS